MGSSDPMDSSIYKNSEYYILVEHGLPVIEIVYEFQTSIGASSDY